MRVGLLKDFLREDAFAHVKEAVAILVAVVAGLGEDLFVGFALNDIVPGGLLVFEGGEAVLEAGDLLLEGGDGEVGLAELEAEVFIFADEGLGAVGLHLNIMMRVKKRAVRI